MPDPTTPLERAIFTADQPNFHPSNILAHPGSTLAGAGVWLSGIAQLLTVPPVSPIGWAVFGIQAAAGLLAALGK